jgi:hypothetical protein
MKVVFFYIRHRKLCFLFKEVYVYETLPENWIMRYKQKHEVCWLTEFDRWRTNEEDQRVEPAFLSASHFRNSYEYLNIYFRVTEKKQQKSESFIEHKLKVTYVGIQQYIGKCNTTNI